MPLDEFDVSLRPGEAAALLNNYREEREVTRWSMRAIPTAADYVGALVVEGHDWQLKSFSLEKPNVPKLSANVAALKRPQQRSLSLG